MSHQTHQPQSTSPGLPGAQPRRSQWVMTVKVFSWALAVTMFSAIVTASGKYWPFNDAYHDPYTVVPRAYAQHPDAFLHAAYSVLDQAQEQPDAVTGYWGPIGGDTSWLFSTVDPTTGRAVEKSSPRGSGQAVVDLPGVPGGRTWS